jgi:hypothetical protein
VSLVRFQLVPPPYYQVIEKSPAKSGAFSVNSPFRLTLMSQSDNSSSFAWQPSKRSAEKENKTTFHQKL